MEGAGRSDWLQQSLRSHVQNLGRRYLGRTLVSGCARLAVIDHGTFTTSPFALFSPVELSSWGISTSVKSEPGNKASPWYKY